VFNAVNLANQLVLVTQRVKGNRHAKQAVQVHIQAAFHFRKIQGVNADNAGIIHQVLKRKAGGVVIVEGIDVGITAIAPIQSVKPRALDESIVAVIPYQQVASFAPIQGIAACQAIQGVVTVSARQLIVGLAALNVICAGAANKILNGAGQANVYLIGTDSHFI